MHTQDTNKGCMTCEEKQEMQNHRYLTAIHHQKNVGDLRYGFHNYAQFLTNYAILLCCIFLSIMLPKCTNYASYMTNYSDINFSYKVQFKNAVENKGEKSHKLSVVVKSYIAT